MIFRITKIMQYSDVTILFLYSSERRYQRDLFILSDNIVSIGNFFLNSFLNCICILNSTRMIIRPQFFYLVVGPSTSLKLYFIPFIIKSLSSSPSNSFSHTGRALTICRVGLLGWRAMRFFAGDVV